MRWLVIIVVVAIAVVLAILFLNRFYRKATREVALIRTGAGGQKVVLDGGCIALPFLHRIDEVNMRTMRIEVARAGPKSLITGDRLRLDVEVEFYVRVEPTRDGIATAAQALGARVFRADELKDLFEGKFIDALQSVVAAETMDALHENRGHFVRRVGDLLNENLGQNGLQLESVSLTRLDQTPFGALDENNAFNAVGMRRLAEVIANNKKKRAEIEADADVSVRNTQLESLKRRLLIERDQEQAQISQKLEIEKLKAGSDAEIARSREESEREREQSKIDRERSVRSAEIERDRELRRLEVEALTHMEVSKLDSQITMAAKRAEESAAQGKAELARAHIIEAQEKVQTGKERAVAERSRELAILQAKRESEVSQLQVRSETESKLQRAKADADAANLEAEAKRYHMVAESEGQAALIQAENGWSESLIRMKIDMKKLDTLPDLAREMMKPVEKIDSIRINQVTGLGGAAGGSGGGENGDRTPVNQAVDSILGMALQYPAMHKLGEAIGLNLETGFDQATKAKTRPDDTDPSNQS